MKAFKSLLLSKLVLSVSILALTEQAALAVVSIGPITRAPNVSDPVRGTCKDLRAAAGRGVKDSEGQVHAGACGFTQVKFLFDGLEIADYSMMIAEQKITPWQVETFRDSTGKNCARAKNFNVELSGNSEVSFLDWLHNKPAASSCAKEWNRLKDVILTHESKHTQDVLPVIQSAQRRLSTATVVHCETNDSPDSGLLEKGLVVFKDTFLAMKSEWNQHASDLDSEGDLCDINCCACSDGSCYAGGFTAMSTSEAGVSFAGGKGQHIELELKGEDKDSQGKVLQQFYTLQRGEFVYPAKVQYGEFDCTLDKTTFPLTPSQADLTLYLNNPTYEKNSYHMGFAIEGNPVGTCQLRSNPEVVITIPLFPFNFGILTDCSTYKTARFKNISLLEGTFANTCSDVTTTLDWSLKRND